jgi:hypothetical protein
MDLVDFTDNNIFENGKKILRFEGLESVLWHLQTTGRSYRDQLLYRLSPLHHLCRFLPLSDYSKQHLAEVLLSGFQRPRLYQGRPLAAEK